MEQPKEIGQLMKSSLEALKKVSEQNSLPAVSDSGYISLYRGDLTPRFLIESSVKVRKAFPALDAGFFEVFNERIKSCGFSDDRLRDAVNFVIETCVYPTPTIAQFISWDKRIKVYSYEEMLKKWDEGTGREAYKPIKFPDREKMVWVDVDDIKKYNIKSL